MPPLKDALMPPANLKDMVPVSPAAGQPSLPPPDSNMPGFDVLSLAPAPAVFSTEGDRQRQFYRRGVSQYRIPPTPTKANPSINASASSISKIVVAPVVTQAAAAQTTATAAQSTADSASTAATSAQTTATAAVFLGAYSGVTAYVVGNKVTYSGNVYQNILASTGVVPTNTTNWTLIGPSTVDNVPDGTTYGRPNLSRLNAGRPWIDFAETIHSNKQLDNIPDGLAYSRSPIIVAPDSVPQNGNFEASASLLPPPAWAQSGSLTLAYETASPLAGTQSIKLATTAQYSGIYTIQHYQCSFGEQYYIKCLAKSDGTGVAQMVLQAWNGTGWDYLSSSSTTSTSPTTLSATVTIGSGDIWFRMLLWNNTASQPSTVWFDDVTVSRIVSLDSEVRDGSTYGRPLLARLNAGKPWIDFSEAIHAGKNVDNVADGATRFARTAAHSSYRPTSNPLTATDAGATATASVAAFTMRVGGTDVLNNSGAITALSYSTLYYLYHDDPSLAGGAVTYNATTVKETALNGAGRFFDGSVITPAATTPDTVGNNDGGVGAQSGGHIRVRGGAVTTAGTASNPANANDGDWTTFGQASVSGDLQGLSANVVVSNFVATNDATRYYTNIVLKVKAAASASTETSQTTTEGISISYSTNGGSSYTAIRSAIAAASGGSASLAVQVDTVTLPNGTDLSKVRVGAFAGSGATSTGAANDGSLVAKMYEAELSADY